MAISRGQLVKELEPGLNALFGLEYKRYEISMLKYTLLNLQTERLKKKLCYQVLFAQVKPEGLQVFLTMLKRLTLRDTVTKL